MSELRSEVGNAPRSTATRLAVRRSVSMPVANTLSDNGSENHWTPEDDVGLLTRLQPGPFLIGQVMTVEHEQGLSHPQIKIHGTRSSGADAPARPGVFGGLRSERCGDSVSRLWTAQWAVGGRKACPTGAGNDDTPHGC
jgi:hypothetical protein